MIANAPCSWGALEFELEAEAPDYVQVYSPFMTAGLLLGADSKQVTQGRLALTRFSQLSPNVSLGFMTFLAPN